MWLAGIGGGFELLRRETHRPGEGFSASGSCPWPFPGVVTWSMADRLWVGGCQQLRLIQCKSFLSHLLQECGSLLSEGSASGTGHCLDVALHIWRPCASGPPQHSFQQSLLPLTHPQGTLQSARGPERNVPSITEGQPGPESRDWEASPIGVPSQPEGKVLWPWCPMAQGWLKMTKNCQKGSVGFCIGL